MSSETTAQDREAPAETAGPAETGQPAPAPRSGAATRLSPSARRMVLAAFFISGVAALIYEVVWTRELSYVFSSTVYAVSIMLAAFMAGLSLGGYLGGLRADSPDRDLVVELSRAQLGIAAFGMLSLPLIRMLPAIQLFVLRELQPPAPVFFGAQMLMAFAVMIVPTTLMGATFPLVSKISVVRYDQLGRTVGELYSANNLGAIVGSLGAGFLLIPFIGGRPTIVVAAVLNLVSALIVRWMGGRPVARMLGAGLLLTVASGGLLFAVPTPTFPLTLGTTPRFSTYAEYRVARDETSVVWSDETAYGRVAVIEDEMTGIRALVNGPLPEGADSPGDRSTTGLLAWLPAAYAPDAQSALVIGLGTGLTSRAMLQTPIERQVTVDIDPAVGVAATYFLDEETLNDPRWEVVYQDARQYLLVTDERFDVISSEPSQPIASSVAALFTREFFQIVRDRLTDDGIFCQWVPQYLMTEDDFKTMYKTFHSVFPNTSVWIYEIDGARGPDIFMIGSKSGATPSPEEIQAAVDAQLKRNGLHSTSIMPMPEQFLFEEALAPDVTMNTDSRRVLEFSIPWNLVESFRTGR